MPRRLADLRGNLVGVEAQPGPAAGADPARAEALCVFVDPAPADPPALGDRLGGDQPALGRLGLPVGQQLGRATGDRLDRVGVEPDLSLLAGHRIDAHRRLPKGARLTFGLPDDLREWWAMRAAAISISAGSSSMPTKCRPSNTAAAPV